MSIKPDRWIRKMAQEQRIVEPFETGQVRAAENGEQQIS